MTQDPNSAPPRTPEPVSTALLMAMALGGVVVLALVLALVFVGRLLDQAAGTRLLFTVGLAVLSAPVSIGLLYQFLLRAVRTGQKKNNTTVDNSSSTEKQP
jgi:membrane protein implicated in regulation of membrane protease activity